MQVFLSYTRVKDQFDVVSVFRRRLENELQQVSPRSCIFQDRDRITAGQHFPVELRGAIARSDVLLILLSPAWLRSEWCRYELGLFTAGLTDHRRSRQVLPVLWTKTRIDLDSSDSIARFLAQINYFDWSDLRHDPINAPAVSRKLAELAQQIVSLSLSGNDQVHGTRQASENATPGEQDVIGQLRIHQYESAADLARRSLSIDPDAAAMHVLFGIALSAGRHLRTLDYQQAKTIHAEFAKGFNDPSCRFFASAALMAIKLEYFKPNAVQDSAPALANLFVGARHTALYPHQREAILALTVTGETAAMLPI